MKLNRLDYIDLNTESGSYIAMAQETASTATNLRAFGMSLLPYSTAANKFTLSAPIAGVEKTIVLNSTLVADSTAINTTIYTGSTAIVIRDNSTLYNDKLYINVQPPYANIRLIGLSTSQWGVIGTHGAVQFSTAGTYSS